MELREYWTILWRRWWVIVALLLLVLAGSIFSRPHPIPMYQASMRFTIGVSSESDGGRVTMDPLYSAYLASEYIADDFTEIVRSESFAGDVSARLAGQGIAVPPGAIQGFTVAEKQHRILTMVITWPDEAQLRAIAQAAGETLEEENAKYFKQLGSEGAEVFVIDSPRVVPLGVGLKDSLEIPIRLALAVLAGAGLAFLLHYLDDTVRDPEEVESLGMGVLGRIPPSGWRERLPWRRRP
ncbi:MAG TPA: Wzz/FepE/Etk N-terminal domain-containing protein [Anaerolineae bacterium]|nr:Wzz/FepE/Etk N-terminal domain-containing protein [Anaerolineae bacterium]